MFKVYSSKFDRFVYAFDIREKPSRDIKLFCPYCTHIDECVGVSFVQAHVKNDSLWKSHFRRTRYCVYRDELPKASEGESVEHLDMKLDVLNYFRSFGYECDLEVRIGDNICDVVVDFDDTKLAIECQISSISHKEVSSRTRNYINHGYAVVWLTPTTGTYASGRAAFMGSVQKTIYKVFGKIWIYDFIYNGVDAERTIWTVDMDKPSRSGYTTIINLSKYMKIANKNDVIVPVEVIDDDSVDDFTEITDKNDVIEPNEFIDGGLIEDCVNQNSRLYVRIYRYMKHKYEKYVGNERISRIIWRW